MNDCIEWTGHRNNCGYGCRSRRTGAGLVHRQAWIDAHGSIPPGMEVMHLCNNPACYNVEHLRLGTHRENLQMAAKLTTRQVIAIRHMHRCGMTQRKVAEFFGVSSQQVSKIVRGLQWKVGV
jgi:hypothetical protein